MYAGTSKNTSLDKYNTIQAADNSQVALKVDTDSIIMQSQSNMQVLPAESSGNIDSTLSDPTNSCETLGEQVSGRTIDMPQSLDCNAFELLSAGFSRISRRDEGEDDTTNQDANEEEKNAQNPVQKDIIKSRHITFAELNSEELSTTENGSTSKQISSFVEGTSSTDGYSTDGNIQTGGDDDGPRILERVQTTTRGDKIVLPIVRRHTPSREDVDMTIDSQSDIQYPSKSYLGEGSFGRVYRGVWQGKKVAVKIFKEEYQNVLGKECTRIFESEFDIMVRLQHENIVECYGGNKDLGKRVIVMEFMEKGSLDLYIHKNPHPIKMLNYYKVLVGLCKALVYLHPTIVHRDIKPQNILLNKSGMVKLADFGLSKFKEATTMLSSNISGTPHYVAPEVLTGKYRTGPKCDIYAIGILMHEMYARQRPWYGVKEFQIAYCIMMDQRPEIPASCPEELAKMIKRCWAANPEDRPTAQELYEWCKEQSEKESQRQEPILLHKPQQQQNNEQ